MIQADQGDRLLWVLGGAVGVLALATLVLVWWPSGKTTAIDDPIPIPNAVRRPPVETSVQPGSSATLADRLERAQLAFAAGMLLEPEGFSAWSLYGKILREAPNEPAATAGLAAVAEALIDRARLAVSDGREAEADALVARVLASFPNHAGAREIRDRPRDAAFAAAPQPRAPGRSLALALPPVADLVRPTATEPPITLAFTRVDRVVETYPEFTRALAAGDLTSPAEHSAEYFVGQMRAIDPVHAMTRDAARQLFDALLERSAAAFDALDTVSALDWLAAAERLSIDPTRIAAQRQAVAEFIAERQSRNVVAASDLTMTRYVSAVFPNTAQRRGVEGWVDVEFVVDSGGVPRDVTTIGSSHSLFEREAIEAAEQWRFEPQRIAGRIVDQRVQTRIRFKLDGD